MCISFLFSLKGGFCHLRDNALALFAFFTLFNKLIGQSHSRYMDRFLYPCNIKTDSDLSNLNSGEVSISVNISDNPEHYTPGDLYEGIRK